MAKPEPDDAREGAYPLCPSCARPMRAAGGLPRTTNLPGVYGYRCERCNEAAVLEDREQHQ